MNIQFNKKNKSTTVGVRFDMDDFIQIKHLAKKNKVSLSIVCRTLIHESLKTINNAKS
jgi:hypothetical protein